MSLDGVEKGLTPVPEEPSGLVNLALTLIDITRALTGTLPQEEMDAVGIAHEYGSGVPEPFEPVKEHITNDLISKLFS